MITLYFIITLYHVLIINFVGTHYSDINTELLYTTLLFLFGTNFLAPWGEPELLLINISCLLWFNVKPHCTLLNLYYSTAAIFNLP